MSTPELVISPKQTALVLIDLQKGITGRQTEPYSSQLAISNCALLANRFRAISSPVVLVHVEYAEDGSDRVTQPVDTPMFSTTNPPPGWRDFVPEIGPKEHDIIITKRNWGAFYGTDLDLQLRRRNINTIILGGIATNFGVESTARDAYERNFAIIFAEDAMASMGAELHVFSIKNIFPRIGRIRSTEQILSALVTV